MKMRNIGWIFFFASIASVAVVCAATKISVPKTGVTYTVGGLFNLINTNNPAMTSRFLILTSKGSQGVDLSEYNSQSVVLYQDAARINVLFKNGCLTNTTKPKYQAIMLYFTLPGSTTRYYINDPNPGKRIRAGSIIRDPAANIIAKWNI